MRKVQSQKNAMTRFGLTVDRLCVTCTHGPWHVCVCIRGLWIDRARLCRFTAVQHEYGPARLRLRASRGRCRTLSNQGPCPTDRVGRACTLAPPSANTARLDLAMLFQFAVLQPRSVLPLLVGAGNSDSQKVAKPRLETRGLVGVSNRARPNSDMSHDPRTATPSPKRVPFCGLLWFDRGPLGPQDLPASRGV